MNLCALCTQRECILVCCINAFGQNKKSLLDVTFLYKAQKYVFKSAVLKRFLQPIMLDIPMLASEKKDEKNQPIQNEKKYNIMEANI